MIDASTYSQAIQEAIPEIARQIAHILSLNNDMKTETIGSFDVFVIISFSEDMEPIFEGMKAAGETNGLNVKRVKDSIGDFRITDKIIKMINDARFIIADLTHEKPNVYFELGFARGLGKTIITTAREGTKIHFDVKDWPCIFYNDSRTLEKTLQNRFQHELNNFTTN